MDDAAIMRIAVLSCATADLACPGRLFVWQSEDPTENDAADLTMSFSRTYVVRADI